MKTSVRSIDDHGVKYEALMFVCPGCCTPYEFIDGTMHTPSGLHMVPVNTALKAPSWDWDGNLEAPTLTPSILTRIHPYTDKGEPMGICHSFLRAGVFEFLSDCTHPFAGMNVPMPDLPTWAEDD